MRGADPVPAEYTIDVQESGGRRGAIGFISADGRSLQAASKSAYVKLVLETGEVVNIAITDHRSGERAGISVDMPIPGLDEP